MSFFKHLFGFYINASIHLGLMAFAMVRITELYFDLPYNKSLDYVVFYGTIFGYNFVKYAEVAKMHHRSLTKSLRSIQVFSAVSLGATIYYGIQLSFKTQLLFMPFGLLTVLYAIPFLSGFQKNLRNIAFVKNIIIAVVWAGVTVLLPVFDAKKNIDSVVFLMLLQRFLMVLVLIIPFDIRDVKYDEDSLKTIPQIIGISQAKKLGYFILILTLVIEFFVAPNQNFRKIFLLVFFIITYLLMRSKINQTKYYSSFYVDGVPIFWWLLLLIILK